MDDIKRRELDQTQKLLVGLTNELFDKGEKMSASKEKSKFEFTDISCYRKKLNVEEKNPGIDSTQTKNSSKGEI